MIAEQQQSNDPDEEDENEAAIAADEFLEKLRADLRKVDPALLATFGATYANTARLLRRLWALLGEQEAERARELATQLIDVLGVLHAEMESARDR